MSCDMNDINSQYSANVIFPVRNTALHLERCQPLVSVVIPVYNAEKTLSSCLESVMNQTYANLEIIVVNDGSTDNSRTIIEDYAIEDSRIVVFEKENAGLVQARKSGIDIASGKYIQYLDSDDTLHEDAVSLLVDKAEKTQADIVVAPFVFCNDGKVQKSTFSAFVELSGRDYLKKILFEKAYWCVWSKFHLRSLYQNEIERPEISLGEDAVLSTQLLMCSHKVTSVDYIIIDYNFTPSSMSHPSNFDDKKYKDFVDYTEWVEKYIIKKGAGNDFQESLAFFHIRNTFRRIYWKRLRDANKEMKRVLIDLKCFPYFMNHLTRRERKIVKTYQTSFFMGYLKLKYYNWRRKI